MIPTIPISLIHYLQLPNHEEACQLLSNGLINQTWICKTPLYESPVVLQQINQHVFKKPLEVVHNHRLIYETWQQQESNYSFKIAAPLPFPDHTFIFFDEMGQAWRMQELIADTVSITKPTHLNQLFEAARCFGEFARMTQKINSQALFSTLDNFHNLRYRYEQFQTSKTTGNTDRINQGASLISQLENRIKYVSQFDIITQSTLQFPERIRHHDAKIANLLFNKSSHKVAAILDLDTTMPGYFFSDLGDMIRSMAGKTDENHTTLQDIGIDEVAYDTIIKGYQSSLENHSTPEENTWIHWSGIWIIYMQCLRFITDYFSNDQYYRIEYPQQNWDRAWNQFYLLKALEKHLYQKFNFDPLNT